MELKLYQVDAFTDRVFAGNPAAVCPLEAWLDDDVMQAVAAENNLSETAFFMPDPEKGPGQFRLRWFTPTDEVDLCGHATLASAHILLTELAPSLPALHFETRSGSLIVTRADQGGYAMDFPALVPRPVEGAQTLIEHLGASLGRRPVEVLRASNLLAVYETEEDVRRLRYQSDLRDVLMEGDSWGLIVTAPAGQSCDYDFVSRFFAPAKGVPEDPVTGSAHCTLAPYWTGRLERDDLTGFQASARGGLVRCRYDPVAHAHRVILSGHCVSYLRGTITV